MPDSEDDKTQAVTVTASGTVIGHLGAGRTRESATAIVTEMLPRTATNMVMRRLREPQLFVTPVFYIYMDSFQRRTKRLFGRRKAAPAA